MARARLQPSYLGKARILVLPLLVIVGGAWSLAGQTKSPAAEQPPAGPSEARQAPETVHDPADKGDNEIRVLSNLVATPVTVTDSKGEFVYDLGEKDFQVYDNGVPQQIQSLAISSRALAVVILIQTSDAVKPLLTQLQPLAPIFSSLLLGPEGRAAVLTYADRISQVQDFSTSGDQLASTLKHLSASGGEARLNDAMARAIALLAKQPQTERRILIAFSDGSDSGSETSEQDVIERAARADVSIYGLGFSRTQALLKTKPQPAGPSPADINVARSLPPNSVHTPTAAENTYGMPGEGLPILDAAGRLIRSASGHHGALEAYTSYTGGVFYSHWSERDLQDQLSRIADEIHSQYELAYVPTDLNQTGFHRIEVRVERPGVKVRTRAGYYFPWARP
jgi:Ca-activated chloride channel homolog